MPTTHNQSLENIVLKLRAQDIAPWRIAYSAIKDEHYLSSIKYTNAHTSLRLHTLTKECGYKNLDIARLLGATQPTMDFPNQIVIAMKELVLHHNLEPSGIIHNLDTPLLFETSWSTTQNILYGYLLAHNDKNYVLDQLYALASKIEQDDKNKEDGQAVSELFYQLRTVFEDNGTEMDMYRHFEQLVKTRADIHNMIMGVMQTPLQTPKD